MLAGRIVAILDPSAHKITLEKITVSNFFRLIHAMSKGQVVQSFGLDEMYKNYPIDLWFKLRLWGQCYSYVSEIDIKIRIFSTSFSNDPRVFS